MNTLQEEVVCRICMSVTEQFQSIFTPVELKGSEVKRIGLSNMICSFSNIKISAGDGLPENICSCCSEETIKSYLFKIRCESSDKSLRISLNNTQTEEKSLQTIVKREKSDYLNIQIFNDVNTIKDADCYEDHRKVVSDNNQQFQCDTSSDKSSEKNLLLKHLLSHTSNIENSKELEEKVCKTEEITTINIDKSFTLFECTLCQNSFLNENELETHMLIHNASSKMQQNTFKFLVFTFIKEDEREFILCNLCNTLYLNDSNLEVHLREHLLTDLKKQNLICNECDKSYEDFDDIQEHVKTDHQSDIPWLHISIRSKEEKRKHERRADVSSIGTYLCTHCNKKFKTIKQYRRHCAHQLRKQDFSCKKVYECNICSKGFNQLSNLRDHARTHNGEKPFLCPECGREFNQLGNMRQHLIRHSGVKSYLCSTCGSGFVSKGELHAHYRKHTGVKPFICDICGNGFTTSSSLTKHKRIHSGEKPYVCEKCNMRFNRAGILKRHRRTHTGEKPYICTYCQKAYSQSNDLNCHMRLHTGEKPFSCVLCGNRFHIKSLLKSHMKSHAVYSQEIQMEKIEIVETDIKDENYVF